MRRDTESEEDALKQVERYLNEAGMNEGWIVLFDLRKEVDWSEKLFVRKVKRGEQRIHVLGC